MVLLPWPRIVDTVEFQEATMTVDTMGTNTPAVFDAGLPAIAYAHTQNPDEAHRLIRQARMQGPIGPWWPCPTSART
jgi:hypothetical protein